MQVPLENITAGNNPRRYMDPSELEELTRSIRSVGVIQPITVKRGEGAEKFIIVTGHRRHKAAIEAGLDTIPVHVIENDEDFDAMALIENTVRADMSPAEESDAAVALLNKNKGDMQEVALLLGWTESKLRRRIALNVCSEKVRNALTERKIKLGIAELLATILDHKNQDKALRSIIERNMTVEQVRQLLLKLVQKLDRAIFDKSECADCRFNTGLQKTLFEETLAEDAFCTNGTCYAKKTTEAVEAKAESLKSDYATVRIVRLGTAEDWTKLKADGPDGVGSEQCQRCASCAHFGATVSALSGDEGKIETEICFDLKCNEAMINAEYAKVNMAEDENEESGAEKSDETGSGTSSTSSSSGTGSRASAKNSHHSVALSTAMQTYRRKIWGAAALKAIAKNAEGAKALLVALILSEKSRDFDGGKVKTVCEKAISGFSFHTKVIGDVAESVAEKSDSLLTVCAGSAVEKMSEEDVRSTLKYLKADLSETWCINKDYLDLMTKTEINALMVELGLDKKIKDWKKLNGGKKDDLTTGIMASGIDFKELIPLNMAF